MFAPIVGTVTKILVAPGAAVKQNQPLIILDAMKMDTYINSPRDSRHRRPSNAGSARASRSARNSSPSSRPAMLEHLMQYLRSTGFTAFTLENVLMIAVSLLIIYLAVAKEFEPLLLLPIGFGALLANIPLSNLMLAAPRGGGGRPRSITSTTASGWRSSRR